MDTGRAITTSHKVESKYERIKKIGIGSYGVVFKCINRHTSQVVAIKRYSENDTDPLIRKIAMREVRMLRQLKHPNLINLIEVFRRKKRLHLVFDYCELTVLDVIEKYTNNCPLNLIKKITWQTVNAIQYCHDHNCLHRDIKPENILINQTGIVKLCDFGFARNFNRSVSHPGRTDRQLEQDSGKNENSSKLTVADGKDQVNLERQAFTDYVATRWYRAPELLIGEIYYDFKIDIWAIGCVTAELMRGEPMWPGRTDYDQLSIIKSSLGRLTAKQIQTLIDRTIYDQAAIERLINQSESQALGNMANGEPLERKLPVRVGQAGVDFVKACLQMDPELRPAADARQQQQAQAQTQAYNNQRTKIGPSGNSNSDLVKRAVGARSDAQRQLEHFVKVGVHPLTLPQLTEVDSLADEHFGWTSAGNPLGRDQTVRQSRLKGKYQTNRNQLVGSRGGKSLVPISTGLTSTKKIAPSRVSPSDISSRLPLVPIKQAALNQQVAINGFGSTDAAHESPIKWKRTPSAGISSSESPSSLMTRANKKHHTHKPDDCGPYSSNSKAKLAKTTSVVLLSGRGGNNNQLTSKDQEVRLQNLDKLGSGNISNRGKIYGGTSPQHGTGISYTIEVVAKDSESSNKKAVPKVEALPSISTPTKRRMPNRNGREMH